MMTATTPAHGQWHTRFLLFVAGMGGLLYGIDVGIIAGALPFLESTAIGMWKLSTQQLGFIVAAVLLGSVLSSLVAGALADAVGRKTVLVLSGLLFSLSVPMIAMAEGYMPLLAGRLLQGISGGLIGVVAPLYLAESLDARYRGRGTAIFQLLLTVGLLAAALIGLAVAHRIESATTAPATVDLLALKDSAWRSIFWACLLPGLIFTVGAAWLSESPRFLIMRGQSQKALQVLLRSRPMLQAKDELAKMEAAARAAPTGTIVSGPAQSLLSRRFVLPFLLACLILACNQATGINSIMAYAVNILGQAGLSGELANWGDVGIKMLNVVMTVIAVLLVDIKGRKFLLMLGTAGIVVSLTCAGFLFGTSEARSRDVAPAVLAQLQAGNATLDVNALVAADKGATLANIQPHQLTVAYSYGAFTNVQVMTSNAAARPQMTISRADTVQADSVIGRTFRQLGLNPFADPASAATAPLRIEQARIGMLPDRTHGIMVMLCIFGFIGFFAVGPGVCVWLALSELMPTRIRSNGMSIALLINQFVSTVIAAIFLPAVGKFGYAPMFFFWAACTAVYFLTATFLLPETKGKTLEEIDAHFTR
jgi:SP family myo-inositol transporter-like MFS transporter 13